MTRLALLPVQALLNVLGRTATRVHHDVVLLDKAASEEERQTQFVNWIANRHLVDMLNLLRVDCVLDVGANEGDFGWALRSAGWRGRIISFEPQSSCRRILERRAAQYTDWSCLPQALGDHDAEATLTLRASSLLTSLREPRPTSALRDEHPWIEPSLASAGTETIEVRRLDGLWGRLPGPPIERAFLKIDTQGHDESVLEGAAGVLPHIVALQTELTQDALYEGTSHYFDVLKKLDTLGYGLNAVFPVTRSPQTQLMVEFDGVFVRK